MKKINKIYDIFGKDQHYLNSDWNVKFRNEILRFLQESNLFMDEFENLEDIHKYVFDKSLLNYSMDGHINDIQKYLYDVDDRFIKLYHQFMKDLYKRLDFDFYFQSSPTIRVHSPDIDTENHYPSYHNDCVYGHPPQELNIWFSLTKNKHSGFFVVDIKNSKKWLDDYNWNYEKFLKDKIEVKNFSDRGNKFSVEVDSTLDSIFIFDSLCIHTNKSRVKDTRVSIDVRINPVDDFIDGFVGGGRMRAEFKPGGRAGYYKKSIGEM